MRFGGQNVRKNQGAVRVRLQCFEMRPVGHIQLHGIAGKVHAITLRINHEVVVNFWKFDLQTAEVTVPTRGVFGDKIGRQPLDLDRAGDSQKVGIDASEAAVELAF